MFIPKVLYLRRKKSEKADGTASSGIGRFDADSNNFRTKSSQGSESTVGMVITSRRPNQVEEQRLMEKLIECQENIRSLEGSESESVVAVEQPTVEE
mmetsp:Transcript_34460/g.61952  ORF Transcript_34460/g.61952 Transcript_34460/m.61952 type:complete len:97 (+) Transcript_34460:2029-2319(+)